MRGFSPILLAAFALGLVSAQCDDPTFDICCASFDDSKSTKVQTILGKDAEAPTGNFGYDCVRPEAGKCPPSKTFVKTSPRTLQKCRYFTAFIGIAGGCVEETTVKK